MEAYVPTLATSTAYHHVMANDQPWNVDRDTQTLIWCSRPAVPTATRMSSIRQPLTYVVVNVPQIAGLDRLREFRGWSDNWDAEGAKAPSTAVIDAATVVFGLLSVHRVPEVTMSSEGLPMFVYGSPVNGEVTVTSENTIDYFFLDDDAPEGEDVAFSNGQLPSDLLEYLRPA